MLLTHKAARTKAPSFLYSWQFQQNQGNCASSFKCKECVSECFSSHSASTLKTQLLCAAGWPSGCGGKFGSFFQSLSLSIKPTSKLTTRDTYFICCIYQKQSCSWDDRPASFRGWKHPPLKKSLRIWPRPSFPVTCASCRVTKEARGSD